MVPGSARPGRGGVRFPDISGPRCPPERLGARSWQGNRAIKQKASGLALCDTIFRTGRALIRHAHRYKCKGLRDLACPAAESGTPVAPGAARQTPTIARGM
mgnify:CR=1 FL=1